MPRPSAGLSLILLGVVLGLFARQYAPTFALTSTADLRPIAVGLDDLEQAIPFCHGEAHELGRAAFSHAHDLREALAVCGHRCTNGCMHGALSAAMIEPGGPALDTLMALCEGGAGEFRHRRGNCAHAIGHGVMLEAAGDLDRGLAGCARLFDETLEYYCVTGVFMEYADAKDQAHPHPAAHRSAEQRHLPCHATAFPAACYRYLLEEMAQVLPLEQLLGECLRLTARARLGCFHGFGAMYFQSVGEDPAILPRICETGTFEDRIMCIEGAIERLADHDEPQARRACRQLEGELASICLAAAREKMYRLDKPTMPLYLP